MDTEKLKIAQRFSTLQKNKRQSFLQALQKQGLNFSLLPIVPRLNNEATPLSYAQQRQWFLQQLTPNNTAYHIVSSLRLLGQLDVSVLQHCFNTLISRHESLRTLFIATDNGLAEQRIVSQMSLDIPCVDLRQQGNAESLACQQMEALISQPFDLQTGPLLRGCLYRVSEDAHLLVLVIHHIISDAWSMQIIVDEFTRLYQALATGETLVMPSLPVQYADYTVWQRNWMEAGEKERQLIYWMKLLGEEHPVLSLPTDHPRMTAPVYHAASQSTQLPEALHEGIKYLAQRCRMTPFMVLLTGFQVLLYRYTSEEKIRIGVPIANRHRVEVEEVIGFFVNTQVFPGELDGAMSLSSLLEKNKKTLLAAQTHQDLPFDILVDALNLDRSLSHNPLFQVMFNYKHAALGEFRRLPELEVSLFEVAKSMAQFELTLDIEEGKKRELTVCFTYAEELFEPATIQRMSKHYLTLLGKMLDDLSVNLASLPLLSDFEEAQLCNWGDNSQTYSAAELVPCLIGQQVEKTPGGIALVFEGQALSYQQLNQQANQLAHYLISQGVGADVPVGIAVERSIGMVVGLLAILKAGGAYVPLDPEYPAERLAYMIEQSGIEQILTQSHVVKYLPPTDNHKIINIDQADFTELPVHNPEIKLQADNLAYVIYTSGSTGKPKGVMVRHGSLSNFLHSMKAEPGLTTNDSLVAVTSLSFDIAALEIYLPIISGARLIVANSSQRKDGQQLEKLINQHSATVMQATPATWRILLDQQWQPQTSFRALCGGEALPVDLADGLQAKGIQLWNLYGPTETTIWSALGQVESNKIVLGKPIAATQLYVVDKYLNLVPQGIAGELLIGGEGLARGYYKRADLTAEHFIANPFSELGERLYRTGDLVRWTTGRALEYLERLDNQVKIRGFRIDLDEIESQLNRHTKIRQAIVVVREGSQGTILAAYIKSRDDYGWSLHEMRQYLGEHLPDYMLPSALQVMDEIPLTPNGKVDRKALPDIEMSSVEYESPNGEIEEALAAIWIDVLKVDRVGRNDNFFELGGHSLLALKITALVSQHHGLSLPVKSLFEWVTIASLATHIEGLPSLSWNQQNYEIDAMDAFMNEVEGNVYEH